MEADKAAGPLGSASSEGLGPLPAAEVPEGSELSDDFSAYADWYTAEQMEAERQRCYELGAASERERWKAMRDRIQADLDRPEGRWGMHGRTAVDDDYFGAMEWVLERMDEVLGPNVRANRPLAVRLSE